MATMNLTGLFQEVSVLLTKYGIAEVTNVQDNITRLTNQLWKLIPMKENEEDWQKQLETLIIEITGMNEVLVINGTLLSLLSKLEGLRQVDVPFMIYRKTVFETITLLQEFGRGLSQ